MPTTAGLKKPGETGILTTVRMQATTTTLSTAGTPETLGTIEECLQQ